jgi:hypothetical protein
VPATTSPGSTTTSTTLEATSGPSSATTSTTVGATGATTAKTLSGGGTAAASGGSGTLARTGSSPRWWQFAAGVALALGGLMVQLTRRERSMTTREPDVLS